MCVFVASEGHCVHMISLHMYFSQVHLCMRMCVYMMLYVHGITEQDDELWGMEEDTEESSSEDEVITSGKLTLEYFLKK